MADIRKNFNVLAIGKRNGLVKDFARLAFDRSMIVFLELNL